MSITPATVSRHWATEFIGKPFAVGQRGPHSFDCWGLIWLAYLKQYGIRLSDYPIDHGRRAHVVGAIATTLCGEDWHRVSKAQEGDVAVMGSNSRLHHVGIWLEIDGGLVLHATKPTVTAQTLQQLTVRGLSHIQFYRYRNGHHSRDNQPI